MDGFASLTSNDNKVAVKILRDPGAKDSFILASVLPFSQDSDTGDCVLVRGMGLNVLCAPSHKVRLSCHLLDGDVHIGVRPAFPIDGVDVILGNDLAGNHVWADGCPPVKSTPLLKEDDCEQEFPGSLSISQQELISEQRADTSLSDVFDQVQLSI